MNTAQKYLSLTTDQTRYAAGLLEIIVNPSVEYFGEEIEEAQKGLWPTRGAGRMKPGWKAK